MSCAVPTRQGGRSWLRSREGYGHEWLRHAARTANFNQWQFRQNHYDPQLSDSSHVQHLIWKILLKL